MITEDRIAQRGMLFAQEFCIPWDTAAPPHSNEFTPTYSDWLIHTRTCTRIRWGWGIGPDVAKQTSAQGPNNHARVTFLSL